MPIVSQPPLLYDFSGKPVSASQAPITNRPGAALTTPQGGMVTLGSDYASPASAQAPKVDSGGSQYVVPVTQAGTPVQVQNMASATAATAAYGQVAMALYGAQYQALIADATMSLIVRHGAHATFSAIAPSVALASAKSLLSISYASTGTMVLRLEAVFCENVSTTTGGLLSGQSFAEVPFELRPMGSATGGTAIAAVSHDTADTLTSGVTIATGATVSGDIGAVRRWTASNYGMTPGTTSSEATGGYTQDSAPMFSRSQANCKPITIRPGYGVYLKCVAANMGTFDVTFIFTQSAA